MKLKKEAFSQCIADVAAQAGVSKESAFGIIQTVADEGNRLRKQGVADPFGQAAERLANEQKIAALLKKSDALRNAIIRNTIFKDMDVAGSGQKAAGILRGMIRFDPRAKSNVSAEGQWHALLKSQLAAIGSQLKAEGLTKLATSGNVDSEVAEVIWRLNKGEPNKDIQISPEAQRIGEIYHGPLTLMKDRQNALGAHIGEGIGHITETQWDERQLQRAAGPGADRVSAFEAWRAKEEPRIAEKTYEHLTPDEGETEAQARTRFLKSVYESTSTGVHRTFYGFQDDGSGYVSPNYEGSRNIGRSVSNKRVVYWKTAKDWYDHQQEFGGGGSLYQSVFSNLYNNTRNIALMEHFGTNPKGNFNTLVDQYTKKYRGPEAEAFQKEIDGKFISGNLRDEFDYLTGEANIPKNEFVSNFVQGYRTLIAESHLGGVVFPHVFSAPMTVSSELTQHGITRFGAIGDTLKAFTKFRSAEEKQEIFDGSTAYSHGWRQGLNKIMPNSGIPGYMSYIANTFMNLTGLPKMIDRFHSEGVMTSLMNNLGRQTEKSWGELNPQLAQTLKHYEIGPEEWDLLRKSESATVEGSDGLKYLTAKAPDKVADADLEGLLRKRGLLKDDDEADTVAKKVQQFRWHLSDRYLMYLNDAAERATVTPGVREQAILLKGTRPGTIPWAGLSALAQFKAWPLAALNQIIAKDYAWSASKASAAANIGWVLGLSTIAGALRMSVLDAVNGRPQKSFLDPNNLTTALAQGGGLGIFGDFLFGEVNRGRNSTAAELFGPMGEDLENFYKTYRQFQLDLDGKKGIANSVDTAWKNISKYAVSTTEGHIPFSNLFYLKGALDYMAFYHMNEAVNPGWWERTNARVKQQTGSYMAGYRPGAGVPYGVPVPGSSQPFLTGQQ